MNEELIKCKASIVNEEIADDIYNNPLVKIILGALSLVPGVKDGVDVALASSLMQFKRKKYRELFEIIFQDNMVTLEDVQDVTVIMEFAKGLDVVNCLSRNGKIKYFAGLLRGSIEEIRNGDVDEFEEWLEKLAGLSEREIALLELLYHCEESCKVNDTSFNLAKSWKCFIDKTKEQYAFTENDAASFIMSIARSGFCMFEWSAGLNNGGTMVSYTTPEYRRLRVRIMKGY